MNMAEGFASSPVNSKNCKKKSVDICMIVGNHHAKHISLFKDSCAEININELKGISRMIKEIKKKNKGANSSDRTEMKEKKEKDSGEELKLEEQKRKGSPSSREEQPNPRGISRSRPSSETTEDTGRSKTNRLKKKNESISRNSGDSYPPLHRCSSSFNYISQIQKTFRNSFQSEWIRREKV
eukprot:TRINITY_DN17042_c0_g1_i1.p1 TRINITY_DN17042_c0_g1~~TRINITY_DN17042_c0_g1_i1.p1  ORF type:complete len:182 (+),score=22.01 TRINITY_DN17042_c0_g1_i1:13-558(+)